MADRGIQYNAGRCTWEEECVTCQKDKMVFSLTPTRESKEVYTSFEVTSATANGLPCEIEQYPTAAKVKEQCQKISRKEDQTVTLPDAFSLVYLRYDEAAAKEAATETVTANLVTYPVITFKLHCTAPCPTEPRWRNWSDWITTLTGMTASSNPHRNTPYPGGVSVCF